MTVNKYALIKDHKVVNTILLDSDNNYRPPEGTSLMLVTDDVSVDWERKDDQWIRPNRPETPGPVEDPTVAQARNTAFSELIRAGISEASARVILRLPAKA